MTDLPESDQLSTIPASTKVNKIKKVVIDCLSKCAITIYRTALDFLTKLGFIEIGDYLEEGASTVTEPSDTLHSASTSSSTSPRSSLPPDTASIDDVILSTGHQFKDDMC